MDIKEFFTEQVKEKGITKMIFEYKEQMERADHKKKFICSLKVIDDIKYTITRTTFGIYSIINVPNIGGKIECCLYQTPVSPRGLQFHICNKYHNRYFDEVDYVKKISRTIDRIPRFSKRKIRYLDLNKNIDFTHILK